eukprot:scaffold123223_cov20-Tisochrysis_lutea.AAC.1
MAGRRGLPTLPSSNVQLSKRRARFKTFPAEIHANHHPFTHACSDKVLQGECLSIHRINEMHACLEQSL